MSTTKERSKPTRTMPFALRPLTDADIQQSVRIEREAFPSQFPPTSFRRELKNRMASYLVACGCDDVVGGGPRPFPRLGVRKETHNRTLVSSLFRNARKLWDGDDEGEREGRGLVAGFVGTWYMVDEAHIVSVGVRRSFRGQGVGDLLLIGAIEQAVARGAEVVSLEVRPSNVVARNLYRKYGFSDRGLRKGYYADNREDAIIMTTDPIHVPPYPGLFRQLERGHRRRWGQSERQLT